MKKFIYFAAVFLIIVASLFAQNMGPEYVNLKERYAPESQMPEVIFPHWIHQAFINCQICHTGSGAVKDWLRWKAFDIRYPAEFHTAFCGYCHDIFVDEGEQNTCIFCHKAGG